LTLRDQIAQQDLEPFPILQTRPFELDSSAPSIVAMPHKRPAVTVEDYDVLMRITAESDSVWITSPVAAQEGIASGSLTQVPLSHSRAHEIDMTAYYLKRRTLSPLAEKILEKMRLLGSELNAVPA
jgi:DNA-binding transcriptional LysR family regulator